MKEIKKEKHLNGDQQILFNDRRVAGPQNKFPSLLTVVIWHQQIFPLLKPEFLFNTQ